MGLPVAATGLPSPAWEDFVFRRHGMNVGRALRCWHVSLLC
jgi:hypothetical protein